MPPKSTYKPIYAEQARKLCKLGATDLEIADFFGKDVGTIYRWRNTKKDFAEATRIGKEAADDRVERSLYNRAVGYTFEVEKLWQYQGEIVRATTNEHVPPDVGAAKLWLTNRRQSEWREKIEQTIKPEEGAVFVVPVVVPNAEKKVIEQ